MSTSRALASALALTTIVVAAGCAEEPTEIVLVVESDLAVPSELDAVRVSAIGPSGQTTTSSADLAAGPALPRTVVLVHAGGPLGPVDVTVTGDLGGAPVVERRLRVRFETGRTLRLRVLLSRDCAAAVAPSCGASETCEAGACRPIDVAPCEYEGRGCMGTDGGVVEDGATPDAPPDLDGGGPDAPPACPLEMPGAICGVADAQLPGDRVTVRTCSDVGAVTWTVVRTDTSEVGRNADGTYTLDRIDAYAITATMMERPACAGTRTIMVVPFELLPSDGRPPDDRRDFAARVGMGFFATKAGPRAVTIAGWRDLRTGATGDPLVGNDLRAVAVWRGQPVFGLTQDANHLSRIDVAGDFSTIAVASIPFARNSADRSTRGLATPIDGDRLAIGTKDGVLVDDSGAGTAETGPSYDPNTGIGTGTREVPNRGAIWAFRPDQVANFTYSGMPALENGASIDAGDFADLRTIAVDDRDETHQRLWLCDADRGLRVYDLAMVAGPDWPQSPLTTIAMLCNDLAIDVDGDVWVATSTGVRRLDRDGAMVATLGSAEGATDGVVSFVDAPYDATTREVWIVTSAGDVHRASVPRGSSTP